MQMRINMDATKVLTALQSPSCSSLGCNLRNSPCTGPGALGSGVCLFTIELAPRAYSREYFAKE